MTPEYEAGFLAGLAAGLAGETLPEALTAEAIQSEALTRGVRRTYRRELAAAFNRGQLWGMRNAIRRLREEHFEEADADTPIPGLDGGAA